MSKVQDETKDDGKGRYPLPDNMPTPRNADEREPDTEEHKEKTAKATPPPDKPKANSEHVGQQYYEKD